MHQSYLSNIEGKEKADQCSRVHESPRDRTDQLGRVAWSAQDHARILVPGGVWRETREIIVGFGSGGPVRDATVLD